MGCRWLNPYPARQYHSPYLGMGNNPIIRIDPDGGADCPEGNCADNPIVLDEVVITAPSAKNNFDYSGMPDYMRYPSLDMTWTSSFKGSLSAYNRKFGTDFGSGNPGNAKTQYDYRFGYKPAYDQMVSDIHASTAEAGEYFLYIMPTPLAGSTTIFKGVPLLSKGAKLGYKNLDETIIVVMNGVNKLIHREKGALINFIYTKSYKSLPRAIRKMVYPLQRMLLRERNIYRNYLSPRLPGQIDKAYKNIKNISKFF